VTRIYCGNLPFSATEEDVRGLFEEYGTVRAAAREASASSRWTPTKPRQLSRVSMAWPTAGATCA
jgi:RNA recognition motif-containing protein